MWDSPPGTLYCTTGTETIACSEVQVLHTLYYMCQSQWRYCNILHTLYWRYWSPYSSDLLMAIIPRQRALQLFKLILLERKVLFFKSPVRHGISSVNVVNCNTWLQVRELSSHILSLLSLFPGMLEAGLDQVGRFIGIYTAVCFNNFFSRIHKLAKLKRKKISVIISRLWKNMLSGSKK